MPWTQCCGGQCCGGTDPPDWNFRCCNGRCVNWATDENNCGIGPDRPCSQKCPPAAFPERTKCCNGLCYDPARWLCCEDGRTLCQADHPDCRASCRPSDIPGRLECTCL